MFLQAVESRVFHRLQYGNTPNSTGGTGSDVGHEEYGVKSSYPRKFFQNAIR
jgi:hypothetical protein